MASVLDRRARELPAGAIRLPALTEMVKIDLERQWQRGQRVGVEHYLRAFPELGPADSPPLDLIETEVAVRTQFGERGIKLRRRVLGGEWQRRRPDEHRVEQRRVVAGKTDERRIEQGGVRECAKLHR